MSEFYAKRRREVFRELKRRELDCLLVTHPASWYYLTGFTGESGALVVASNSKTTLITDGRFTSFKRRRRRLGYAWNRKGGSYASLGDWLKQSGMRRVGL